MIAKKKKKKTEKRRILFFSFSIFFIFIFLSIGFILVFSNWQMMKRNRDLSIRTQTLKEEIAGLEKENKDLKNGIESVSEENYLEREARDKFQLQKPGEKVIAVLPPEKETEIVVTTEPKSFFQKVLEWLGF